MTTISIGIRPSRTQRLSQSDVTKAASTARSMLTSVCGLNMPGSSNPTVYIFVVSEQWARQTFNLPPRWNAFAYGRGVYLNYSGTASTVKRLAVEILHEILHTWGYNNAPRMGHNNTPWCIMYRSGSKSNYFCPQEVLYLQAKYGRPNKKFKAAPVERAKYLENKFHKKWKDGGSSSDLKKYRKFKKRRESLQWQWKKVPMCQV